MSKFFKGFGNALSLFLLFLVFASIAAGQKISNTIQNEDFKNLAGPVEEISLMRLPAASTLGTRSKSVMIPIRAGDGFRQFEIPVDSTQNFKLMLLAPNGRVTSLRTAQPGESFLDLRAANLSGQVRREESTYGLDGNQFPAEIFTYESLKSGFLRVQVEFSKDLKPSAEPVGYLVASSDSPYRLYSYIDTLQTTAGREIGIVSSLFNQQENADQGQPAPIRGSIRASRVVVNAPTGETFELMMNEGASGEFISKFTPRTAGRYTAQVFSDGATPEGAEFMRSSELTFEVSRQRAEFRSGARMTPLDDLRWRIALPVAGLKTGERVIAHAEIWGRDENGAEFPVSWLGGMTVAESSAKRPASLSLTLDSRWLVQNPEAKSYFLKNVRLQNPDNSVLLGEAETITLPPFKVSDSARSFVGFITDEMRQGIRPAKMSNEAVGGKLMLVHGYCSGDAWGAAASAGQFSNYVKFLDLNKNRSHDQFAQLIRNFGASLPSFGIVAHSQGGAASLHLYTYYWSGLDYATGTRLIQSVGTPYQGTALAGNLALLGQIFGAGCGSNYDLTYTGAAAWLANIPTWARVKVYYHTTSFSDVWWRYDYCNVATDPFLSDPDDGVVERAYAQLSGAVNLGHKTGWCHTGGMRDPSQTTDAARNTNMNANAAR